MHDLHVDDDTFIRAPRELVYRRLTDVGSWPTWWRGCRTDRQPDTDGHETWLLRARRDRWRELRVHVQFHDFRHDTGLAMTLTGDVDGRAEFWMSEGYGGVTLHHLMTGTTTRRPTATLATYRWVLRRGMFGCKDATQTDVRTAIGMTP